MTPKNSRRAPTATSQISLVTSTAPRERSTPMMRHGMLATSRTVPMTRRLRSGRARSSRRSLMAAIGEMRDARIAGMIAEPTVTNTPTAIATITVRSSTTSGPSGTWKPSSPTNARSNAARPIPTRSPRTAATSPTIPRFDDHGDDDLATARTHRPQQPELPSALRDEDRERVEDDECTDDEADRGEPEQELREHREEVTELAASISRELARERHLEAPPEHVPGCGSSARDR